MFREVGESLEGYKWSLMGVSGGRSVGKSAGRNVESKDCI